MGCTGGKTYEEAVREDLKRYFHNFKLTNTQDKEIWSFINQDLKKKAIALNNYQYIYRDEDAKQTAEDYKRIIKEKFGVGDAMYNQFPKIEEDKNNNNENNNNSNNNKNNNNNNNNTNNNEINNNNNNGTNPNLNKNTNNTNSK